MALPIQLQITDSNYTENSQGIRSLKISAKYNLNVAADYFTVTYTPFTPHNLINPVANGYLKLTTVDGTVTNISQENVTIRLYGNPQSLTETDFEFTVIGNENLPDNVMRAEIYLWLQGNPISYSAYIEKSLTFDQSSFNVPESATISLDNVSFNSVFLSWNPHSDGGSPITSYHVVIKNEDTGQTFIELDPNANTTSQLIQGLESGTNYKVYIMVINAVGNSFEQSKMFTTLGSTTPVVIPDGFHQMPDGSIMADSDMYNFIIESDGLVRMFRIGAVEYTEIKVQPESVQDFIDRNIGRLLTAAERAIPYPRVEPEPEPTFCVNAYNIRDSGDVYAVSYLSVTAAKVEELKLTQFVLSCDSPTLPTNKEVQDFYGFVPLPPAVDTTINSTMVSQSIGAFVLKDGIVKGEILYIANQSFNPFYYGKNLTSLVQIKSKSGVVVTIKPNVLNFTETERDETITIDESAGNFKELLIDFFVWDSPTSQLIFAESKQIQIVDETDVTPVDPIDPKPPTTCQSGYHKDFSGKCVPDDPVGEIPRDKLIDTLKGFLFGTVALSLLARKY